MGEEPPARSGCLRGYRQVPSGRNVRVGGPAPSFLRLKPANIAEGCGRSGDAELGRFMLIAMGSANELEYHLLLARDLDFMEAQDYQELSQRTEEVKRMLSTFITRLRPSKKLTS